MSENTVASEYTSMDEATLALVTKTIADYVCEAEADMMESIEATIAVTAFVNRLRKAGVTLSVAQ